MQHLENSTWFLGDFAASYNGCAHPLWVMQKRLLHCEKPFQPLLVHGGFSYRRHTIFCPCPFFQRDVEHCDCPTCCVRTAHCITSRSLAGQASHCKHTTFCSSRFFQRDVEHGCCVTPYLQTLHFTASVGLSRFSQRKHTTRCSCLRSRWVQDGDTRVLEGTKRVQESSKNEFRQDF